MRRSSARTGRPEHYDRNYLYIEAEPVHSDNIHMKRTIVRAADRCTLT
jgi:hypothetical protein